VRFKILPPRVALAVLAAFLSAAAGFAEGSGEPWAAEERTEIHVSGFTAVSTGSGIAVEIKQATEYRVTLIADRDFADRIRIEKVGDELRIGVREWFTAPLFTWRRGARVLIDMPDLARLRSSGGAPVVIRMDAGTAEVEVTLSGGASVRGSLSCGALFLDGSGGSHARLEGSADRLELTGSGGAVNDFDGFAVRYADARLSGGASARVLARESLSVNASGGAHLSYRGAPRMDRQVLSGGAWVRSE
jgi:hypothetical protein